MKAFPQKTIWNNRSIEILKEGSRVILCNVINSQTKIDPMMSKINHGEASIRGGMDEEHGGYIEGRISVSWGGDSQSTSDSKNSGSEKTEVSDTNTQSDK